MRFYHLLLLFLTLLFLGPISADELKQMPFLPPGIPPGSLAQDTEHLFTLRHVFHFGTDRNSKSHLRQQITASSEIWLDDEDGSLKPMQPLLVKGRPTSIQRLVDRRPSSIEPMLAAARAEAGYNTMSPSAWTVDVIAGPNVTDRETVINMALMASNAYTRMPNTGEWEDVGFGFNSSLDIGWESNGLRGHVFADETNSTIVIGLKGTSRAVYDNKETETNDKENDNLFFSCCCAQQGQWTFRTVCDCATSTFTCNQTCLVESLREEHRYYPAARQLYSNVTAMYPNANIWTTGHSLGGAVSSLLGLTYGLPTVTFEAPAEALAASRLGLPIPNSLDGRHQSRSNTGVYHFGHTADPVFMGTCTGAAATCSWAGYAFQTQCHAGNICEYDTVGDLGWRQSILTHKLNVVIKSVLRAYPEVPKCRMDDVCVDCFNWNYYRSNSSNPITTTTSSRMRTPTRTSTCESPGWWGCKDTSTTSRMISTTSSTVITTTTTSTSTCKTPGWFWCLDKTSTPSATRGPLITTSCVSGQTTSTRSASSIDKPESPLPLSLPTSS